MKKSNHNREKSFVGVSSATCCKFARRIVFGKLREMKGPAGFSLLQCQRKLALGETKKRIEREVS